MIRPHRILKTSSYHIISIEHFALRMQGWATSTWEVIHKGMVTRDHRRSRTLGDFKQERQNNHWWVLSRRAVELRPKNPLIDVWVGSQKIRGLPRLQRHRMYKSNQSRATEWKSRIISIYSNGPLFFFTAMADHGASNCSESYQHTPAALQRHSSKVRDAFLKGKKAKKVCMSTLQLLVK